MFIFPIALLQNLTEKSTRIVSFERNEYYYNNVEQLKFIACPTCNEKGGIFKGFFYLSCNKCYNVFLTQDEMLKHLAITGGDYDTNIRT